VIWCVGVRRRGRRLGAAGRLSTSGVQAIDRLVIKARGLPQAFALLKGGDRLPRVRPGDAVDLAVIEAFALQLALRFFDARGGGVGAEASIVERVLAR